MQRPLQITYRNMETSFSVDEQIRRRAAELEEHFGGLVSCRVTVEAHHRHRQGNIFHVRVELGVPGGEIVVNRDPPEHHAHEDAHVAVRDAFDAARRRLADKARRVRGQTKTHEQPTTGQVSKLIAEQGYGFIVTPDGDEIYFNSNAVTDGGFDRLTIGDEVRFVVQPNEGEKGPQASTVVLLHRHHAA